MHEMSIALSLLDMIKAKAGEHKVTGVHLQVGAISCVSPASLQNAFSHLSKDSVAQEAKLHFEILPLELDCVDCGRKTSIELKSGEKLMDILSQAYKTGCVCGSKNLKPAKGVQCNLASIEVVD